MSKWRKKLIQKIQLICLKRASLFMTDIIRMMEARKKELMLDKALEAKNHIIKARQIILKIIAEDVGRYL